MKVTDLIRGLQLLQPYYNEPGGENVYSEYEGELRANRTDEPVPEAIVNELVRLGWFQVDGIGCRYDGGTGDHEYNPNEPWVAFL